MLVSTDGSLGPLVLEESPVKQSVRQDYEITGFIFKKWDFFDEISNYQLLMTDPAAWS